MDNKLRAQIYNNLVLKDTQELIEIWEADDTAKWTEEALDIVREILVQRLGQLPPLSEEATVARILRRVERLLEEDELEKALSECNVVLELSPNSALAHCYRGEIHARLGESEEAITDYQRAIQLDPNLRDAWEGMLNIEAELEEQFEASQEKRHLDSALEYADDGETERAIQECELAESSIPSIAAAYNYLGIVQQALSRLEPAIDSYLKAILLNPRFYAARENLANARVQWEEERYLRISRLPPDQILEETAMNEEYKGAAGAGSVVGGDQIPGWMYLNPKGFFLIGWAGHRQRPGRMGLDPLESNFELAHMEGVIIRRLITRRFRTGNPVFLLFMTFMGLVYLLYGASGLAIAFASGIWLGIALIPYSMIGVALWVNVFSSLQTKKPNELEDDGHTFF